MKVAGTRSFLLPRSIARRRPPELMRPRWQRLQRRAKRSRSLLLRCVASAPPIPRCHLLAYGFLEAPSTRSAISRSPAWRPSMVVSGGEEGEQPLPDEVVFGTWILVIDLAHPDECTMASQITHKTNPWLGEHVQLSYEKKCAQLRTQDANGVEPFAIERTRAATRDLRTKLNISAAFVDYVS